MSNYFEYGPAVQEMFKDFSIFNSDGHFVLRSRMLGQFY